MNDFEQWAKLPKEDYKKKQVELFAKKFYDTLSGLCSMAVFFGVDAKYLLKNYLTALEQAEKKPLKITAKMA